MSLATLKKKTKSKYSKISSSVRYQPKRELVTENNETYYKTTYEIFHKPDYVGFSLNNPRRVGSHSNKGQTQTPMKGTALRGHGSCCGKFPIKINKSQYVNYDNHVRDFSSDKMNQGISVKNHHGSMAIRHKWLKRGYPHYLVKTTRQTDYDTYHDNLHKQSALQNDGETAITQDSCEGNSCNKKTSDIVKNVGPLTHSEYLKSKYLQKRCLPTPVSKLHSPVPINGPCNSCGNGNENQAVPQSKGVICE